jgi:hypothetical protein
MCKQSSVSGTHAKAIVNRQKSMCIQGLNLCRRCQYTTITDKSPAPLAHSVLPAVPGANALLRARVPATARSHDVPRFERVGAGVKL